MTPPGGWDPVMRLLSMSRPVWLCQGRPKCDGGLVVSIWFIMMALDDGTIIGSFAYCNEREGRVSGEGRLV